jgi:hypothetical protein
MNCAILIEFVAITPVDHRANWTSQPHAGPPHLESIHYLSRDIMSRNFGFRPPNRNVEREFNPDRKDHHWGKRKLARDQ